VTDKIIRAKVTDKIIRAKVTDKGMEADLEMAHHQPPALALGQIRIPAVHLQEQLP